MISPELAGAISIVLTNQGRKSYTLEEVDCFICLSCSAESYTDANVVRLHQDIIERAHSIANAEEDQELRKAYKKRLGAREE